MQNRARCALPAESWAVVLWEKLRLWSCKTRKAVFRCIFLSDDICPDENKDLYNIVFKKLLDIGDFVGIKGFVFRTQMGEISVHAQEMTVLSKSLRPLPIVKIQRRCSLWWFQWSWVALPSALCGLGGEWWSKGYFLETYESIQLYA